MTRFAFASLLAALLLSSCMTGRAVSLSGSQPSDLTDCFRRLDSLLGVEKIAQIKAMPEDDFASKGPFGLSKWMRSNWWLYPEGELARNFHALGVTHPDDMSDIIFTSYYRYLHRRPLDVQAQVQRVRAFRESVVLRALVDSDTIQTAPGK